MATLETEPLHSNGGPYVSHVRRLDSIPRFFTNSDSGEVIRLLGLNFLVCKRCLGTNEACKYVLKSPMPHICIDSVRTSAQATSSPTHSSFQEPRLPPGLAELLVFLLSPSSLCRASCNLNYRSVAKRGPETRITAIRCGRTSPRRLLPHSSHYSSAPNLPHTHPHVLYLTA